MVGLKADFEGSASWQFVFFFLTVVDFVKRKKMLRKDVIIYVASIVFSVLFGSC